MHKYSLVQVNFQYGENVFLPYSVGLLAAGIKRDSNLNSKFQLDQLVYLRDDLEKTVESLKNSDIVGFSCYIWNWEYTLELSRRLKLLNPKVLTVFGGPQVPHSKIDIFKTFPFIDLVVIGEGEFAFSEILTHFSDSSKLPLQAIKGILINNNGERIQTESRKRPEDLSPIASPYLDGIFDGLIANKQFKFQASQETHRGCPYSCTFCDWGSATMQKVRRFTHERIISEFNWIGKNKIEVLYNCDANYGLFKEDIDLTKEMIAVKKSYGFPKKFRAAFAKNSNERIFEINKMLNEEDMSKGATLSLQSVDSHTLEQIKRRNMKINNFSELVNLYENSNMPTYTELIIGLPGESYSSFGTGINKVLEAGQHDGLSIYPAMILPNAVMNEDNYRSLHGIKTVVTPLLLLHGSPNQMIPEEKNEIVIETLTMPSADWKRSMLLAWIVQALHCLNLTQMVSRILETNFEIKFLTFYENLIKNCLLNPTLNDNIQKLNIILDNVVSGIGNFDLADRRFGNIVWPVEEILFLRLLNDGFYNDLSENISKIFELPRDFCDQLVEFQKFSLKQYSNAKKSEEFSFDFLKSINESSPLNKFKDRKISYCSTKSEDFESVEKYAREIVWYGRKGSNMKRILNILK